MTDRAGFREAIMILRGLLAKPYFCSKFRVRAEEAILSLFLTREAKRFQIT